MNKISMSGCSLTPFKFNLVEVKAKIYCKNKYLDFIHVEEVSKSTFRALKKRLVNFIIHPSTGMIFA